MSFLGEMQMFDSAIRRLQAAHDKTFGVFEAPLAADLIALLARLTLAGVFWRSFLTKVETFGLFQYTEYINDFAVERAHVKLPILPLDVKPAVLFQFEQYDLPLLPSAAAAWLATLGEFVLPIALVLGVFSRLSALGLIVMTLVIEFFVIDGAFWGTHALWLTMALYLTASGPGRISIDHLSRGFFAR